MEVSRRAAFSQADLNRAMRAAAPFGYEVRIEGGAIRLLPTSHEPSPSSAAQADTDWDSAMGREWRRSA